MSPSVQKKLEGTFLDPKKETQIGDVEPLPKQTDDVARTQVEETVYKVMNYPDMVPQGRTSSGHKVTSTKPTREENISSIVDDPTRRDEFIEMMITNPGKYNLKAVQEKFFPHMSYSTFRHAKTGYGNNIRDILISKGFADFGPNTKALYNNGIITELQEGFLGEEAIKKLIKLHGKGVTPSAIANTLEGTVDLTGPSLRSNVTLYTKRGGYLDELYKKDPDFFDKKYKPKYADEKVVRKDATSGTGKKFKVNEIDESWVDPSVADGYYINPRTGEAFTTDNLRLQQAKYAGTTTLKKIFPFLRPSPGTKQSGTTASIALIPESGHRLPAVTSIKMNDPLQFTDLKIQTTAINQKLFAGQKGSSLDAVINNKVETIQQILKSDDALTDPDLLAAINKNVGDINKIYDDAYEMLYKSFGDRVPRDVFPKMAIVGNELKLSNPGSLLTPKSTEQLFKDYFYDVAASLSLSNKVSKEKFGMTADQMLNQFRQHKKNKFPNASIQVWEDIVASLRGALKETDEAKRLKLFDKADELIADTVKSVEEGKKLFRKGGKVREGFAEPAGLVGQDQDDREDEVNKRKPIFADYLSAKIDQATARENFDKLPESQKKQMAFFLKDPVMGQERIEKERVADASVRYKIDEKDDSISSIRARIAEEMIDAKPTKFPLSSFPKLLTQNPLTKSMQRQFNLPFLILGDVANTICLLYTSDAADE